MNYELPPEIVISADVKRLTDDVKKQLLRNVDRIRWSKSSTSKKPSELTGKQQTELVLVLSCFYICDQIASKQHQKSEGKSNPRLMKTSAVYSVEGLIVSYSASRLPFSEVQIAWLLQALTDARLQGVYVEQIPLLQMIRKRDAPIAFSQPLLELAKKLIDANSEGVGRETDNEIIRDFMQRPSQRIPVLVETGEPWVDVLGSAWLELPPIEQEQWAIFFDHALKAKTGKPSARWLKQAAEFVERLGDESFLEISLAVVRSIGKPGTPPTSSHDGRVTELDPTIVHDDNSDLLRGLIWATASIDSASLIQAVGEALEICFQKIAGIGPRSTKIGNACLVGLAQQRNVSAVSHISRLKARTKYASVRKQLKKALDTAAANAGVSPDEVEEIAVPDCGLTSVGQTDRKFGDFTAHLKVLEGNKTQIIWSKNDGPAGKTQKSVPSAVKTDHADALKQLKKDAKEISLTLAAQRFRVDRLFRSARRIPLKDFRTRYLNHVVIGVLAQKLIWRFHKGSKTLEGCWCGDAFVDSSGVPLVNLTEDAEVELWHPLDSTADEVLAWRQFLFDKEIKQPFKQAHREVYLLTDAEITTKTYSNRFAAHIIRQHQFHALCQQRGWTYNLQGKFDSHNIPYIELPQQELRAEFWVESVDAGSDGISDMGIFLYLATDQTRFYQRGQAEPLSLETVPPRLFSELMRDVDLFVGVCSVSNDPTWADGGAQGHVLNYWTQQSFCDLSQTAQTRRAVLEQLVPRLKITSLCSFDDKFLIVKGKLRTYKIHLGSGNILMSPNDQYLCIVQDRSNAKVDASVFLPFEGDAMLSLILSKAFLLAKDDKIKDATILSQINVVK